MKKTVSIKTKQQTSAAAKEAWVKSREAGAENEPLKRLTIDIPESLHTRIKTSCAIRGLVMADDIRALLYEKYPEA
jgi:hypothetical protein